MKIGTILKLHFVQNQTFSFCFVLLRFGFFQEKRIFPFFLSDEKKV